MELEVDSVSERHGSVEVDISVSGNESVTLDLEDVLQNVSSDSLLDRVEHSDIREYIADHDVIDADWIKEYAKENDITLQGGTEVNADTVIAWLREADDNQLFAVATALVAKLAALGALILEAHK